MSDEGSLTETASRESEPFFASGVVGLVAGSGALPLQFARTMQQQGRALMVAAHLGETDPEMEHLAGKLSWIRLGQVKRALHFFRQHAVTDVVFVGGIQKTRIWSMRPDMLAIRLMAKLRHKHDDHLLRAIAAEVERHGFAVRSVTDYMPELLASEGVLTQREPSEAEWDDIRFGWQAAKALGALDIGQGLVVRDRVVAAVEALEGTDALIRRAGPLTAGQGVMIKTAKPNQDLRLDLPTIGPGTMESLHASGLSVMAIEAGRVMILDPGETFALADRYGLTVVACRAAEMGRH
ncbi:MAG: UDP-2,3-diacylglucosamine diphosphatase LpxI [Magnetococcales bacterium]|nr:UDP-2,3-diacylglucosamine diphosphatase LpxI [Magnetococcales bacterium]